MSHYTVVKNTKLDDYPILIKTLKKCGYEFKENYFIRGYQKRREVDLAIKIDGKYRVGFEKNSGGSYDVVADWSLFRMSSKDFMSDLQQTYNAEKVIHEARLRGYSLVQQKVVNGGTRLVLRKMG